MKARASGFLWSMLMACVGVVQAQAEVSAPTQQPEASHVIPGERLSNWLLRNAGPHADTTALHWTVWAEQARQQRLKQAVLRGVQGHERLYTWLYALPSTGRLNVPIADPRWLEVAPSQDPILQENQSVVLYPRPNSVTLLSESGIPCPVLHNANASYADYLRACWGQAALDAVDWVWVAQSDGKTRRFGIKPWNVGLQDEAGPGAWIWAPKRLSAISDSVSDNLIRFLATQPPFDPVHTVMRRVTSLTGDGPASPRKYDRRPVASDWGEIGLLQTPTARMMPVGDARLHISRVLPYTRGTVMLQPLEWLEAGFRYTDISNRLYGADITGRQSNKDKSLDFKVRLLEEGSWIPQVALGVRDLGGTGLFSGEYLVASKRWGEWDASLGLGWGYLGARGNIRNPLGVLSSKFEQRPPVDTGQGGVPSFSTMFRGPSAFFGGIQWQPMDSPWTLKLELDGNNYQREPQNNNQVVRSPINLGLTYAYSPNIDLSLGLERGRSWMMGLTFHGGLNQLYSPKLLDPPTPAVRSGLASPSEVTAPKTLAQLVQAYTGWRVEGLEQSGSVLTVVAETDGALYLQERIERAVAVLNNMAGDGIEKFRFILQERGLALTHVELDRAEWRSQHLAPMPPSLQLPTAEVSPWRQSANVNNLAKPSTSWDVGPSFNQVLGGPDGFVLYQLGARAKFEHAFAPGTWLAGKLNLRLLDNYGKFVADGPSDLPRVRTDLRRYALASRLTMPLLQLTHVDRLSSDQYLSVYGGMLEPMFGGVGTEWLYRPWRSPLAFGVDINHVRKRDYGQNFKWLDYKTNSGHASLYWDTGWEDVQLALSVGQYLAGDRGVTLDLKKVFPNGVTMGAWATKTNVSAQQFGEGSFDKGIYATIPMDAMLPKSSPDEALILWRPLTRDGGARLNRQFSLMDLTKQLDPRALGWRENKPISMKTASDTSYILTDPVPNLFESLGPDGLKLGDQVAQLPAKTWAWAGGAVLASHLIDRKVDNWAQRHQGGPWERMGQWGNKLPLAMALGTGILYTGLAGQDAANTAQSSLKAGAYTIGASLLARGVLGRHRPLDGLGAASFDGLNREAFQSGFPSNHTALAFALVTPFAQKNEAPWLYGLAGLSAFGRVQSRQHWLSDTVAGGLLGYAVGSLVGMQSKTDGMYLTGTANSVVAHWPLR